MFFDKNGAQAYGIRFEDYVILAFRGTEPTQFSDIKADLRAFHVKNELGIGRVHKGFKNQVNHLWPEIEKSLNNSISFSRGQLNPIIPISSNPTWIVLGSSKLMASSHIFLIAFVAVVLKTFNV